MSATDLGALLLGLSGALAAAAARLVGPYPQAGRRMLLELWTAAILLHLSGARGPASIAAAVVAVLVRGLAMHGPPRRALSSPSARHRP